MFLGLVPAMEFMPNLLLKLLLSIMKKWSVFTVKKGCYTYKTVKYKSPFTGSFVWVVTDKKVLAINMLKIHFCISILMYFCPLPSWFNPVEKSLFFLKIIFIQCGSLAVKLYKKHF